jgi:alkanesulfonate monooxygenase SsuD/methylene tetrahydromethanopterin reductase-like flavin-dependent oxidoreductase (luciferase family)
MGLLRRLFTRPIPIWLGGSSEPAFDRAARLADGFIFSGADIDSGVAAWGRLRERVISQGRSIEDFGADLVVRPQGVGVDDVPAALDAWRAAGGTHFSVVTMGLGLPSADSHIDYLASLAAALGLANRH